MLFTDECVPDELLDVFHKLIYPLLAGVAFTTAGTCCCRVSHVRRTVAHCLHRHVWAYWPDLMECAGVFITGFGMECEEFLVSVQRQRLDGP